MLLGAKLRGWAGGEEGELSQTTTNTLQVAVSHALAEKEGELTSHK